MVRVANHSYINAGSVCDLLSLLADRRGPVTVVLDNARYQRCAAVREAAAGLGIELLFLPSYSPNLNLIERVWKFVKKQALATRTPADYAAFTAAIDDCLDRLHREFKPDMDALLTHRFQVVASRQ
jgi:transposase